MRRMNAVLLDRRSKRTAHVRVATALTLSAAAILIFLLLRIMSNDCVAMLFQPCYLLHPHVAIAFSQTRVAMYCS